MEKTITCPSGLTGRVKPLSARSASVLTDQRAIRTGKAADSILKACWEETLDLGPYPFTGGVDWSRVLVCDRTVALVGIRQVTYGDIYPLSLSCPTCLQKFFWDVPLSELTMKPLSADAKTRIVAGSNEFATKLSDGRELKWRLLTGKDLTDWMPRFREGREDLVVQVVKSRVVSIEGIQPNQLDGYLSDLVMGEVQDLIVQMDEVDGGIETEIEVRCPACYFEWAIELPLDLQGMFSPRRRSGPTASLKHTGPIPG